jgi:hypothetical protein
MKRAPFVEELKKSKAATAHDDRAKTEITIFFVLSEKYFRGFINEIAKESGPAKIGIKTKMVTIIARSLIRLA